MMGLYFAIRFTDLVCVWSARNACGGATCYRAPTFPAPPNPLSPPPSARVFISLCRHPRLQQASPVGLVPQTAAKAAPILWLAATSWRSAGGGTPKELARYSTYVAVGLLFCAGGDIALELGGDGPDAAQHYFIGGLVSFLIGARRCPPPRRRSPAGRAHVLCTRCEGCVGVWLRVAAVRATAAASRCMRLRSANTAARGGRIGRVFSC